MSQKGFAPVLIILLIVVLGVAGVFVFEKYFDKSYLPPEDSVVSQSTSSSNSPGVASMSADTANWKTYTDPAWKISFKYPADWFLFTQGTSGIGDSIAVANYDITYGPSKGNLQTRLRINIYKKKTNVTSIDDYLKSESGGEILPSSKVVIDGIEGKKYNSIGLGSGIEVYILKDGYMYSLSAWDRHSNYISTFDQILATFKFLP